MGVEPVFVDFLRQKPAVAESVGTLILRLHGNRFARLSLALYIERAPTITVVLQTKKRSSVGGFSDFGPI